MPEGINKLRGNWWSEGEGGIRVTAVERINTARQSLHTVNLPIPLFLRAFICIFVHYCNKQMLANLSHEDTPTPSSLLFVG